MKIFLLRILLIFCGPFVVFAADKVNVLDEGDIEFEANKANATLIYRLSCMPDPGIKWTGEGDGLVFSIKVEIKTKNKASDATESLGVVTFKVLQKDGNVFLRERELTKEEISYLSKVLFYEEVFSLPYEKDGGHLIPNSFRPNPVMDTVPFTLERYDSRDKSKVILTRVGSRNGAFDRVSSVFDEFVKPWLKESQAR